MRPIEELLGKRLPPDGSLGLSANEVDELDAQIRIMGEEVAFLTSRLHEAEGRAIELSIELEEWKSSPFSKWLETLFSKHK